MAAIKEIEKDVPNGCLIDLAFTGFKEDLSILTYLKMFGFPSILCRPTDSFFKSMLQHFTLTGLTQ